MSKFFFTRSLIIGLGLIGGSFAKALSKFQLSEEIFGYDLDSETLELAKSEGVINGGAADFNLFENNFISTINLIVIAAPLSSYEEIFAEIANQISPNAIIIDLGSLKNFIDEILPKNLEKNFIACHPIAGSEKIGFENSSADIFSGKKFIICKSQKNDAVAVKKIEDLVKEIGCSVDFTDSVRHDEIYALVSHLPQFLSFLTAEFSPKNIKDNFFKTAFRLDNSDPEIWSDIFELNAENLEKFYLKFFAELEKLIEEIRLPRPTLPLICSDENSHLGHFSHFAETASQQESIKLLEQNFAPLFFRALIAKSYLKIPEVKIFQPYAGKGFKDFTSIVEILDYNKPKLQNLVEKNRQKILKLFSSIS